LQIYFEEEVQEWSRADAEFAESCRLGQLIEEEDEDLFLSLIVNCADVFGSKSNPK
jgi:hypothetical protein